MNNKSFKEYVDRFFQGLARIFVALASIAFYTFVSLASFAFALALILVPVFVVLHFIVKYW